MPEPRAILEGHIAVLAALEAESRPIHTIYLRRGQKKSRSWRRLQRLAQSRGIPIVNADAAAIDELACGKTHGGVLAQVGERRYAAPSDLLRPQQTAFIVMLDGIEDPFNFGHAVRALYAAGAQGLVLRPRNWMSAANVVAKASAGATERIPVTVFETAEEAAQFFHSQGLQVACTAQRQAVSLYEADLTVPLFMVVGGEKRGITRSFLAQADLLLRIPYASQFTYSLPADAAAAILAFEVMRQRLSTL